MTGRRPLRRPCSTLFALTALAVLAVSIPTAGQADPYKWCAVYGGKGGGNGANCGFVTLEQCHAAISGAGGTCDLNQFYISSARAARQTRTQASQ
jgi:hypothetical protein